MSDALSQNPGSERGTTPGSALSIGVGVSSTSLFARRRRFLSLFLLLATLFHSPCLASSYVLTSTPFILLRHPRTTLLFVSVYPRFFFSLALITLPITVSLSVAQNHPSIRRASTISIYFFSIFSISLHIRRSHLCPAG